MIKNWTLKNKRIKYFLFLIIMCLVYLVIGLCCVLFLNNNVETKRVDNINVANLISVTKSISTYNNVVTSLSSFYNGLENKEDYIYQTNKFLCNGSSASISCETSSVYSNIGLINLSEYYAVEELYSYLANSNSYFTMTNGTTGVYNLTSSGAVEVDATLTSGIRPTLYIQDDVKVTGSGTSSDPYVFSDKEYIVTINAVNGTVTPASQVIRYNRTATFTGKASSGYTVEEATISCTNGLVGSIDENGLITVFEVRKNDTCTVTFIPTAKLYEQILADNTNRYTRTSFVSPLATSNNGNGIYYASGQDGARTYYFAGAVTNNYVMFGKANYTEYRGYYSASDLTYKSYSTLAECTGASNYNINCQLTVSPGDDLWWRIVRINEDNSVRLIYAGLNAADTNGYIGSSPFNSSSYTGYMYGTAGNPSANRSNENDSTMKTFLEDWYDNNFNQTTYKDSNGYTYDKSVSKTAIYCSDRQPSTSETSINGVAGISPNPTYYGAYVRVYKLNNPSFVCTNIEDRFSVTNSSARLEQPIALITADEIKYAGAGTPTNYISQNAISEDWNFYWTMSPVMFSYAPSTGGANNFFVMSSEVVGELGGIATLVQAPARPVISLKSCVYVSSGNGTSTNPYTIGINNACSTSNN